jgi:hypothetical protein
LFYELRSLVKKDYSPEARLKAVDGVLASVEVGAVEVQLTLLTLFLKR